MDWKTEIETGPLAPELAPFVAAGNDGQVAALLNAKTIDAVRSVNRSVFRAWAAKSGMRSAIQDISVDMASPLRDSALSLLDMMQGGNTDDVINLADADLLAMLNGWVALNKLKPAHRDALVALATIKISRAEVSMGRDASIEDVARIRGK